MARACAFCGWHTREPDQAVTGFLATWHVYEKHPEIRRQVMGDRPPRDPDPRIPWVRMQVSGN